MLLVANERAGRTQRDGVATVLDVLRTAGPVEHVECHTQADLDPVLDRRDGRTVVVVGGDGSLHAMLGAIQKKVFVWKSGFWGERGYGWHYDLMLLLMNLVILLSGGGKFVLL